MNIKNIVLPLIGMVALASSDPVGYEWQAAQLGYSRSPCPMLNALANHGYLPRDGLNVDEDQVIAALNQSVNFVGSLIGVIEAALTTSTTGNSSTFHLADTAKHGVLEHDGSLSRNDTFFGDNLSFNADVWATTAARFTDDVISIEAAAQARAARVQADSLVNPEFALPPFLQGNSFFETSLYLVIFGDRVNGNAPTDWIKALFEDERLPFAEGYVRPEEGIESDDLFNMAAKVEAVPAP